MILTKNEKIEEYVKSYESPEYFIQKYLKTFDMTRGGYVPFKLFKGQKKMLASLVESRLNIVNKPRQVGATTVTAAYCAWLLCFADEDNPEKIMIMANKALQAQDILNKIKDFLSQIPPFFFGEFYDESKKDTNSGHIEGKGSVKAIKLLNKSECVAFATSKDAFRGRTPTLLIADECAFLDCDQTEMYSATIMALSTGGGAIFLSTPNGFDGFYYKTYFEAERKANGFNIVKLRWWMDERYNKGLKWKKVIGEETIYEDEIDFSIDEMFQREKDGWEAESEWFLGQCNLLNNNQKAINRELLCKFEGSAGNVINYEYINRVKQQEVEEPLLKVDIQNGMWIWEEPLEGHEYIGFIDPSKGAGQDNACLQIINVTTMEQAAEFCGDVRPEVLAEIVNTWTNHYNCITSIDITGGYGSACINQLEHLKYKLFAKNKDESVGITFSGANRPKIIQNGVSFIENAEIKVKSARTAVEMETFVWVGSKAEHMRGFKDDCLIALFCGLYMLKFMLRQLQAATKLDIGILQAMIDANQKGVPERHVSNKQLQNLQKTYIAAHKFTDVLLNQVNHEKIAKNKELIEKYGIPFFMTS